MSPPGSGVELDALLDAHRDGVGAALDRSVQRLRTLVPGELAEAAAHGLLGGGKRLRPVLCAVAYEAAGGVPHEAVYDLAAALEMIHAYSLMHDDLPCMDDAALRRGRPTTHVEHGEDVTMRAGFALIPAAALQAASAAERLGAPPERVGRIVGELLSAAGAGGMVGGQWLDLRGEGESLGADALDELHRRKTGALLTASLALGALAAGASDAVEEALRAYGRSVGLAFQITDDILDVTGSAETLGKVPSDNELGKSTYVALYGLKGASERAEAQVEAALSALARAGLEAPELVVLGRYIVERRA